jgi:hypothetical protein
VLQYKYIKKHGGLFMFKTIAKIIGYKNYEQDLASYNIKELRGELKSDKTVARFRMACLMGTATVLALTAGYLNWNKISDTYQKFNEKRQATALDEAELTIARLEAENARLSTRKEQVVYVQPKQTTNYEKQNADVVKDMLNTAKNMNAENLKNQKAAQQNSAQPNINIYNNNTNAPTNNNNQPEVNQQRFFTPVKDYDSNQVFQKNRTYYTARLRFNPYNHQERHINKNEFPGLLDGQNVYFKIRPISKNEKVITITDPVDNKIKMFVVDKQYKNNNRSYYNRRSSSRFFGLKIN